MRRASRRSRTEHLKEVLVISRKDVCQGTEAKSESAESQQVDKPKFLGWANVILVPGLVAAFAFLVSWFAFLVSWSFVFEYSFRSGLPLQLYFDPIDYVQLTPRWGYVFIVLFAILCASVVAIIFCSNALRLKHPAFASVIAKAVRTPTGKIMTYVIAPLLSFLLLVQFAWSMGKLEVKGIKQVTVSAIFRKGVNTPLEGRLLFQLSRYVLILADDKHLIAIPQTEVQMIQTPQNSPWLRGTSPASSALPAITATPSSTSPTSPEPK